MAHSRDAAWAARVLLRRDSSGAMTDDRIPPGLDRSRTGAMALPLAMRLWSDGPEGAVQRMLLLGLALVVAHVWAAVFTRGTGPAPGWRGVAFATMFVLFLPGAVPWGAAALALSFGAVFGCEIFGGRAILPPAMVGLAFAIFSFPDGGFESRSLNLSSPDPLFALSCLPGAAFLLLRGSLAWTTVVGAAAGAAVAGWLMDDPRWWQQAGIGTFAAGVLFMAAAPEGAATGRAAGALHGMLVGALIIVLRLADPDHPDGVVFAVLLGGLFAPLLDRAISWRPADG